MHGDAVLFLPRRKGIGDGQDGILQLEFIRKKGRIELRRRRVKEIGLGRHAEVRICGQSFLEQSIEVVQGGNAGDAIGVEAVEGLVEVE